MKNSRTDTLEDNLHLLCRAASTQADYFQPSAALLRQDEAAALLKRRWRKAGIAAFGLVAVTVMAAQYTERSTPPPRLTGGQVSTRVPGTTQSMRCQAPGCEPGAAERTAVPNRIPTSPEAVIKNMLMNKVPIPEVSAPPEPRTPEPSQAEKELRESQPDGSC